MKLYDKKGKKYIAFGCKKPKMSWHAGRTWDHTNSVIVDKDGRDVNVRFYIDTTWGQNLYFDFNGRWYSLSLYGNPIKKVPGVCGIMDSRYLTIEKLYVNKQEKKTHE
jgi:hypothetical protein